MQKHKNGSNLKAPLIIKVSPKGAFVGAKEVFELQECFHNLERRLN